MRKGLPTKEDLNELLERVENRKIAPTMGDVGMILRQRDLHGLTQAYLWAQGIAATVGWMESNIAAGDWLDYVVYESIEQKSGIAAANLSTPYIVSFVDLSRIDSRAVVCNVVGGKTNGIVNDIQMKAICETGLTGPDKGEGGKYLFVSPERDIPEDHDCDFVYHLRSNIFWIGTKILDESEKPKILDESKIYPYGSTMKESTTQVVEMPVKEHPPYVPFMNAKRGLDFWKSIHDVIQTEPFGIEDSVPLAFLQRVGIAKGADWNDLQMHHKRLLKNAEIQGYFMARGMQVNRDEVFPESVFWEDTFWTRPLLMDDVETCIDENNCLELDEMVSYMCGSFAVSNGMLQDTVGGGNHNLASFKDKDGEYLTGDDDYLITIPENCPCEDFWSLECYRVETNSFVLNDRKMPGINSKQDGIKLQDNGCCVVVFTSVPSRYPDHNVIQTVPGEGFFVYNRVHSPRKEFYDKTWRLESFEKLPPVSIIMPVEDPGIPTY